MFFPISRALLVMFIYCRHRSVVANRDVSTRI